MKGREARALMGIINDFKSCEPEAVPLVKERFHRALNHFGLSCVTAKRKSDSPVEDLYIKTVVDGRKGIVAVEGGYHASGFVRFLSGVEAKNWLAEHVGVTA